MRRAFKFFTGFLLAYGVIFLIFNFKHIKSFNKILPSYYAKEYCSCRWVSNLSAEYCENYARQYIDISDYQTNEEKKTITVQALLNESTAAFINPAIGCRLEE